MVSALSQAIRDPGCSDGDLQLERTGKNVLCTTCMSLLAYAWGLPESYMPAVCILAEAYHSTCIYHLYDFQTCYLTKDFSILQCSNTPPQHNHYRQSVSIMITVIISNNTMG